MGGRGFPGEERISSSIRTLTIGPFAVVMLAAAVLAGLPACGTGSPSLAGSWHRNGLRRSQGAVDDEGREHGAWAFWYANGELREVGTYEHGRRVGPWTQFHENGLLASRGNRIWDDELRASPRHGPWTFWYSNGRVQAQGSFERGRREGPWEFRHHDSGALDPRQSGSYTAGVKTADL